MRFLNDALAGIFNGLREVWSNKVRSLLSMSGVILGVAALVTMVGIVQGMLSNMRASFELGGGILMVRIVPAEAPESQQHIAGISPGMTWADVEAIQHAIPLVAAINPVIDMNWERFVANGRRDGSILHGVAPDHLLIVDRDLKHGRFISDSDIESKAPVIVVGNEIVHELFDDRDNVVGEAVRVKGQVYTIIGQFEELKSLMGRGGGRMRWENRYNYIPATTAMSRYRGDYSVDRIEVLAESVETMPDLIEQLQNTLRQTHRGIEDFEIETREEELAQLRTLERSFVFSLGGIAGISLLVGGIGIMNVMLASVSERIREIGVRKAIGARSHDVFIQFLSEAVVTSVLGGLMGLMLSVGLLELARLYIPDGQAIQLFPFAAMLAGFIFSSGIGLLAGIYPALRASRLDPIDALRHE